MMVLRRQNVAMGRHRLMPADLAAIDSREGRYRAGMAEVVEDDIVYLLQKLRIFVFGHVGPSFHNK